MNDARILSMLGLAYKAGRVKSGMEATRAAMAQHQAHLVLAACDITEKNYFKLQNQLRESDYGGCSIVKCQSSAFELGAAIGKGPVMAVAVLDKGFTAALQIRLAFKEGDI